LENDQETVVEIEVKSKSVEFDHHLTLPQYIEKIRDGLLSKKLIYEDGIGLTSVV